MNCLFLKLTSTYRTIPFTGTLFGYVHLQSEYAMVSYAGFLFWSTVFPFKYRAASGNGKTKYAFIAAMVACFSGPLLALIILKDGTFVSNFFISLCTVRNPTDYYVVVTLHNSILAWMLSSLLVCVIWRIFKV